MELLDRGYLTLIAILIIVLISSIIYAPKSILLENNTSSTYGVPKITPVIQSLKTENVINSNHIEYPRIQANITPKITRVPIKPKETQIPLPVGKYRISTFISNSTSTTTDVFVGLTYYTQARMTLTCDSGYQNITSPIYSMPDKILYEFDNTTCKVHHNAHVDYFLVNGNGKNITMPMEYEIRQFKLNITGD